MMVWVLAETPGTVAGRPIPRRRMRPALFFC